MRTGMQMASPRVIACLMVMAMVALGCSVVSAASFQRQRSDADNQNALSERKLKEVAGRFVFDEDVCTDVLTWLGETADINIVLTDSAVDDSLPPDELMSIDLRGLSYGKALEILLRKHHACYTINHGVVMIISEDCEYDPENLRTKYFDCRLLIETIRTPTLLQNQSTGGQVDSGISPEGAYAARCNHILTTLKKMSDVESWSDAGGVGEIVFVDGVLIVKQSESNLQKIENSLVDMHSILDIKMPVRAIVEASNEVAEESTRDEHESPFSRKGESKKGRSADPFKSTP